MTAKFKSLNENLPIYDDWLFVSKGSLRWIVLDQGESWSCRSSSRSVKIDEIDFTSPRKLAPGVRPAAAVQRILGRRLFSISGNSKIREATIEGRKGILTRKLLKIEVGDVIDVPIVFKVLRHKQENSGKLIAHAGKWTSRHEVRRAADVANRVLGQAGIRLKVVSIENADVRTHLGPRIDTRHHASTGNPYPATEFQYYKNIKPLRKSGAINVFVVNDVLNHSASEATNRTAEFNILTGVEKEPSIEEWGRTIAHEVGHSLGFPRGHPPSTFRGTNGKTKTRYLMAADLPDEVDTGIPKPHVIRMRSAAVMLQGKIP